MKFINKEKIQNIRAFAKIFCCRNDQNLETPLNAPLSNTFIKRFTFLERHEFFPSWKKIVLKPHCDTIGDWSDPEWLSVEFVANLKENYFWREDWNRSHQHRAMVLTS